MDAPDSTRPRRKRAAASQPGAEHDRQAQPVGTEERPRSPFAVVGIGASAGGLESAIQFFETMRTDSGIAFVLVQHLPPDRETLIDEILSNKTRMAVRKAEDGLAVEPNHVYVIRPGHTLTIRDGRLRLGAPVSRPMHSRPIDDFFKSLAEEQRELAIAIVLSGMGSNGAAGAQAIKAVGGLCIAQDPESAAFPSMPRHLIDAGYADFILKPADMPDALLSYVGHPYAREAEDALGELLRKDQQNVREILAVLRTRTRHDFGGYKKATLLRRIQRRMGLARVTKLADYVRILRQTPGEVTALADDLLIHVTGFFRDPDAWETLRNQVVVPLVKAREPGSSIRCWVAACASGEEAYSLAVLLVEEAEKEGKSLDIKIFATDTAERTLQSARQGVYPGGIEADVSPERIERFFRRENSVYRVRQDLRECVIFAPQDVLRDPPFSRLDIITCRNLLIYLEPELQQRVLSLVHFGLREGGALFLGTSETALGDGLFEPIDKKARIFRRVGATRHGATSFPMPAKLTTPTDVLPRESRPTTTKPTLAQLTTRELLEHHTPAAVTIDRDFRILYYHGDTSEFLVQPSGEPTRDLMVVVRDTIRGAVRTAVHRALGFTGQKGDVATEVAWFGQEGDSHDQILVRVSPIRPKLDGECLIVSFERFTALTTPGQKPVAADAEGADALRRVRDELQSTIEELQTSNEELKAAHEEVVSTNEELQSSNEELETSREEMQSLNEELSTVNSQLQSKMEEYQSVSSDLASLLTSTDIAVLFLDTRFRIRRFTPAVNDLLDVIASDIGRPLSDLARKFEDPDLLRDATQVLERLIPTQREISTDSGRWFLRRITPYRTAENRIDGVVVTFVETTERRRAEQALRRSEEQFRRAIEDAPLPIILLAEGGEVLQLSSAWTDQTGYTIREVPSLEAWLHLVDDAAAARLLSSLGDLYAGRMRTVALELQIRTRQGRSLHWAFSASTPSALPDGRRLAVGMAVDITDIKRVEAELQASRDANAAASEMKDQFLANVSHELRTPLSVILMWARLLAADEVPDADQREAVDAILRSAETQRRLIEDLLDTTRFASGKLRVVRKPIELGCVVQAAADAIRPLAAAKGVGLDVRIGVEGQRILGDPCRLEQVVWILLHNAVKFSTSGTDIVLTLTAEGEGVVLTVSDRGAGIPEDLLPNLFQPFVQADDAAERVRTGLGLGLSIAKSLVQMHDGTIEASSAGPDQGSTFTVRLPVLSADAEQAAMTGAETASRRRLDGVTVHLVEDHDDAREAIRISLQHAGARVTCSASAEDALTRLRVDVPQVIVSDIGLPGMSGLELVRELRQLDKDHPGVRVKAVALTATVSPRNRAAAAEAGFDAFLAKPVDPDTMISTIQDVLRSKDS